MLNASLLHADDTDAADKRSFFLIRENPFNLRHLRAIKNYSYLRAMIHEYKKTKYVEK